MNVIWTADYVRQMSTVDIGTAVATTTGLVTPVLRAVERMPISVLAAATHDFAERAREGRLHQHELEGGSSTVTNLGMYGTEEFAAIINPPQSSIVAVRCGSSGAGCYKERQGATAVGDSGYRFGRPPSYRRRHRGPLDACFSRGSRAVDPTPCLKAVVALTRRRTVFASWAGCGRDVAKRWIGDERGHGDLSDRGDPWRRIGPEVISGGLTVLQRAAELTGSFALKTTEYPWSCEWYLRPRSDDARGRTRAAA